MTLAFQHLGQGVSAFYTVAIMLQFDWLSTSASYPRPVVMYSVYKAIDSGLNTTAISDRTNATQTSSGTAILFQKHTPKPRL